LKLWGTASGLARGLTPDAIRLAVRARPHARRHVAILRSQMPDPRQQMLVETLA
jgi:hypothetical protein